MKYYKRWNKGSYNIMFIHCSYFNKNIQTAQSILILPLLHCFLFRQVTIDDLINHGRSFLYEWNLKLCLLKFNLKFVLMNIMFNVYIQMCVDGWVCS